MVLSDRLELGSANATHPRGGPPSVHLGFASPLASSAVCVLGPAVPWFGLLSLIAYLNGCKLRRFTSARVMGCQMIGTICALSGGFYCGPEGPIIHIGGCVGKLLLRSLYHMAGLATHCGGPLNSFFAAFAKLRNDLDQRDFVAIGSGAGVAAAFMAPISGTLFVAEEAASHFSLSFAPPRRSSRSGRPTGSMSSS